jgi:hypothetical protein
VRRDLSAGLIGFSTAFLSKNRDWDSKEQAGKRSRHRRPTDDHNGTQNAQAHLSQTQEVCKPACHGAQQGIEQSGDGQCL